MIKLFGRKDAGPTIAVHVLIRGRIGEGWYDIDDTVRVAPGTTLAQLIAASGRLKLPLDAALRDSPHLAHTLMWNGERCPVDEHGGRTLSDGDELFLLAPLAGG
jgi:molybdopterin converting factor small subunit